MLNVHVRNDSQDERRRHEDGILILGRAPEGEGQAFVVRDLRVSRQQARIELGDDSSVLVENLGKEIRLDDGTSISRGGRRQLRLPVRLDVGHTTIDLSAESSPEQGGLHTIAPPVSGERRAGGASLASLGDSPPAERLARWFETLLAVQAAAASSDAFRQRTARAVVELVGLDRGLVLRREGEDWTVLGSHAVDGQDSRRFSRTVLKKVLRERRTFYDCPSGPDLARSLMSLQCVVASPIFGPDGEIAGIVYGSRDLRRAPTRGGISPLEAQVVQLLAGAVSAGLARLEQEREAARLRVQFEQFFSPKLAAELERNPRLLDATEREITVLFSDVRGFSRIAERLGARATYELVGDLLDALTARVLEAGGVVVDYYGDGLEAMWNAPADQPGHAAHACRAAMAMQAALPALDERWSQRLGEPLRVGIGVHGGRALVGNAGSRRRLKYGPRGHVVNLASRVESATKRLGVPILVTGEVVEGAGGAVATRRLGRARVAGVDELVDLHELLPDGSPAGEQRRAHAEALALFEGGRFEEAARLASTIPAGPAVDLLRASIAAGSAAAGAAFDLR